MSRIRRREALAVRSDSGFTLVELLVALALLSLIMVCVIEGVDLSGRAWKAGRARERQGAIEAAVSVIERQLGGAVAAAAPALDGTAHIVFIGHPQDLVFVTLSPGYTQVGGLLRTHLWFSPGDETVDKAHGAATGAVKMVNDIFRPATAFNEPATATATTLLNNVQSLELIYWGPDVPAESWTPRRDWLGFDRLPWLMTVRIVLGNRDAVTLTTAIRIRTGR